MRDGATEMEDSDFLGFVDLAIDVVAVFAKETVGIVDSVVEIGGEAAKMVWAVWIGIPVGW